ncbi:unnamed protein product [Miscanthus lutarioriparius]|uniref:Uncharacterized protein n=1 Tax=Miscanthus lutarioriparius TaxID=422564 RepID=A0A811RJI8_9POAL|nr:unnamed protein product [Miscanthus lutarioriparius]
MQPTESKGLSSSIFISRCRAVWIHIGEMSCSSYKVKRISGFDPPPARVFAWRVLELKEQGVREDDAMAVADMEYRTQKKAKKKAYKELKEIARSEGKKPPPNPYPSAIKEIQAEEKKYVMDRLFNPKVIEIANKMKEERDKLRQDRAADGL